MQKFATGDYTLTELWTSDNEPSFHTLTKDGYWDTISSNHLVYAIKAENDGIFDDIVLWDTATQTRTNLGTNIANFAGTLTYHSTYVYGIIKPNSGSTYTLARWKVGSMGIASCTACPAGKTSLFGSDAEADCQCAAGTYHVPGELILNSQLDSKENIGTYTRVGNEPGSITLTNTFAYFREWNAIASINLETGASTVIAGIQSTPGDVTGSGSNARFTFFERQGSMAINADNTKLYVSDYYNEKIKSIELTSPYTVTTFWNFNYAITYERTRSTFIFGDFLYLCSTKGRLDQCTFTGSCTMISDVLDSNGNHMLD